MARNPPRSIESLTVQDPDDADSDDERIWGTVDPSNVPEVNDGTAYECECSFEEYEEGDHTLAKSFDKWDLYACKRCGGFVWYHAARRDYL